MGKFFTSAVLLSLSLIIFSCEKRDCEENDTGTLYLLNRTPTPVQFYFDGVYLYDVQSLETETLELKVGQHIIAGKLEGSTYEDTLTWEETLNISQCMEETYTFEF